MVTPAALDRLAGIVRHAGDAILNVSHARAAMKEDGSPVTGADRAAHRAILGDLAAWTPSTPVVSEEGDVPAYDVRREWTRFWLVDPLDGTKEFLSGNGEYTVNVALIEDERPVLGAVFAPVQDLLYLAGRGLGAWKEQGAQGRVRIFSSAAAAGQPVVVAESRSHPSDALEGFLKTIPILRRVKAGSSLKFCWVAEGRADLYPRFGRTMEWDTAAGDCVYRQSARDGERWSPLRYNTRSLAHESFVIGLAAPEAAGSVRSVV
jgi:3'(2'), 5'-bisphosphate nucleotidase